MFFDVAGKVVVGGGSDKKTNFMEPTIVSGVKLDDPLMQVILKKKKDMKTKKDQNIHKDANKRPATKYRSKYKTNKNTRFIHPI